MILSKSTHPLGSVGDRGAAGARGGGPEDIENRREK
jgi:hypothetical protein